MKSFMKMVGAGLVGAVLALSAPVLAAQLIQDSLVVNGTLSTTNQITAASSVTLPSGGHAAACIAISATGVAYCVGTGTPTLSMPKGSFYINNAGSSTSTRAYIASDAVGTWVAITSAS